MTYSFYVGCYTKEPQDKGLHLLSLNTNTGALQLENSYHAGESPSFLIRSGDFLYAANEIRGIGKVSAFSVNSAKDLAYLNSREAAGGITCHVAEMNGFLYAANYSNGSIFGVEILQDGSLGKIVSEIQHEGSGPNQGRQKGPHAHSTNPIPHDNLLIAADLGADKLFCYRQHSDGSLVPDSVFPAVCAPSGGGPRHLALHPDGKRIYAVMELGVSIVCYNLSQAGLKQEGVYPLCEDAFTDSDSAADIHFAAGGTRLYASIRGKNLISAFSVSGDGSLQFIGCYPTFGESPRNFCFSPDEKFTLIAHQISGEVVVCPVDPQTGVVGDALSCITLPGSSCVINA